MYSRVGLRRCLQSCLTLAEHPAQWCSYVCSHVPRTELWWSEAAPFCRCYCCALCAELHCSTEPAVVCLYVFMPLCILVGVCVLSGVQASNNGVWEDSLIQLIKNTNVRSFCCLCQSMFSIRHAHSASRFQNHWLHDVAQQLVQLGAWCYYARIVTASDLFAAELCRRHRCGSNSSIFNR